MTSREDGIVPTLELRKRVLRRALEAAAGGSTSELGDLFTENLHGWSPNLSVWSRAELEQEFAERDDVLSNVAIVLDTVTGDGPTLIAEWRLTGEHTGALALDEDTVLEPTGCEVTLAGATFAEFRGDRICRFRNYFDEAALLEQLLIA